MIEGATVNYKEYKCQRCGWVHAAIPLAAAQEQVQSVNSWHASKSEPETEDIAGYMRCFPCGAPTSKLIHALPVDAPMGGTIQGVVVPGVWP